MPAKNLPSSTWSSGVLMLAALLVLGMGHARAENWGGTQIIGSGVAKTESRPATGVRNISLGVHANVEIRQDGTEGLTITGDDNIVPMIETVVDNGTLKIRWAGKGNYSTRYKDLNIVVNAANIEALTVGGSGMIHAAKLKAGNLRATIAGSGDIAIDSLDATSLTANIAGSGDMAVAGRVDSFEVTIAGSGDVAAPKLEARVVKVTVQGSGDADVWATESLTATVAGSGDIIYHGKPQVRQTVAGSGSIAAAKGAS
jgi:Putative auto-transporter adhesin, head GIN domain